ncbi:peptide chain release factor N(5)-glutamine methyltransferase [Candidatus Uhrbacteria bacterium]|nr:peptide chain release factor N(5)-glutamine methyltransferase [Candidatus Uhrbacteria bacterium]
MTTLTLDQWLTKAEKRLAKVIKDKEIAHQDMCWIAAKALNQDRSWLIAHGDSALTTIQTWKLNRLLRRRLRDEPLAYLLGSAPFFGRDFYVDKRVLIPRPETEDLVELALRRLEHMRQPTIVDIGTGSGAIAVTIALEHPNANVIASDVSLRALSVAKKNAKILGANIQFARGNLVHPTVIDHIANKNPLVVLANLPYLPIADKLRMPKSVTAYEPKRALFAPNDGRSLNEELLIQASLYEPRLILLELDPPQAKKLRDYARSFFPDATIRIHQDRCGRDRILEVANND